MANPDWSNMTNPPEVLLAGNSRSWPSDIIVTQMGVGPPKMRQRSTAPPTPGNYACRIDEAQRDELYTFYVTSCCGGSLVFDWPNPHGSGTIEMQWLATPTEQKLGDDLYHITLNCAKMP